MISDFFTGQTVPLLSVLKVMFIPALISVLVFCYFFYKGRRRNYLSYLEILNLISILFIISIMSIYNIFLYITIIIYFIFIGFYLAKFKKTLDMTKLIINLFALIIIPIICYEINSIFYTEFAPKGTLVIDLRTNSILDPILSLIFYGPFYALYISIIFLTSNALLEKINKK